MAVEDELLLEGVGALLSEFRNGRPRPPTRRRSPPYTSFMARKAAAISGSSVEESSAVDALALGQFGPQGSLCAPQLRAVSCSGSRDSSFCSRRPAWGIGEAKRRVSAGFSFLSSSGVRKPLMVISCFSSRGFRFSSPPAHRTLLPRSAQRNCQQSKPVETTRYSHVPMSSQPPDGPGIDPQIPSSANSR